MSNTYDDGSKIKKNFVPENVARSKTSAPKSQTQQPTL
jgi:hypothetical protein